MNALPDSSPAAPDKTDRLTSWALGELPADEADAFAAELAADPALAAAAEETKAFCALLDQSLAQPTPELKEAARARLLFEAARPQRSAAASRVIWLRRVSLVAACVAAGTGVVWLAAPERFRAATAFKVRNDGAVDAFGSHNMNARDSLAMAPAVPVAPAAPMGAMPGESKPAAAVTSQPLVAAANVSGRELATASAPAEPIVLGRERAQGALPLEVAASGPATRRIPAPAIRSELPGEPVLPGLDAAPTTALAGMPADPAAPVPAAKPAPVSELAATAVGGLPSPARAAALGDGLQRSDEWGGAGREAAEKRFHLAPPPAKPDTAAESYQALPPNPFREVSREPLSTFSIDVDTASYANVRRFLDRGQAPPPAAVRLEELVNYFPYEAAPPVDGKPFAVHVDITAAPWQAQHRVARVVLKGREVPQSERPAANLVFLVDVSGSMQDTNKLPLVKQSLRFVVERLTDRDTVSLVTYAGQSGVALPATSGADKPRILAAIESLGAGGSTNGAGGITMAYDEAARNFRREGINRVILATDGDFNVGVTSHGDLQQLITEKARSGVFLSVLGYGMGNTKDDTMELLADKGNGNYAYIDSLSEARKALGEQFSGTLVTIAKDVKIQIEFNPAVVRSYRLLGYENRLLAKEDFNDDRKDAGEIGAGHTVTALYEIVPVGAAPVPVAVDGLKYQPNPEPAPAAVPPSGPASDETMNVKLRWKAPDSDTSQLMEVPVKDDGRPLAQAAPEMRWALAVAGFASLLRDARLQALTWDDVRQLASSAKGADPHGHRGEFLRLIDKAESLRPR